ncbi:ABC transporter substrate-binding protein [Thermosphaera chiliense]|uniref:ABC transporter substrate-binding protein n=1 Tax=Thermosphaera chiliense TaxID=3402707 RepID=A0A7M1UP59_9CREN|nr:ABC transporter substrate-binding protein [Thermosphaera aggregans]QOR94001.1 ABC transporter substrate-binding protein [Thermosphaera aggregans]
MLRNLLVGVSMILIILSSLVSIPSTTGEWPWVPSEPYPWLEYLKSLTNDRGVVLRVITRHEQSILSLTKQLFLNSPVAQELGIIDIQFLYVAAESWPDYITRAKSLGTPIDVAWGGGPTLFNNIYAMGFLQEINSSIHPAHNAILYELSKIPERIAGAETYRVDGNGSLVWIGASVSSFGFTINKNVLNRYGVPTPAKWGDLASPEYARYLPYIHIVGIADPTMSTSNTRIFEIILQAKGWEEGWRILTLLAANAIIYSGSGDVRDAVIQGDIGIGTTIDFYGYMAMSNNPACEYIIPANESIVNADPIALLKDSRYPVHAAAFVAWVLSEYGGQQVWLDREINRLPINPRVFNTPGGQERPDLYQALQNIQQAGGILFNETLSTKWVDAVVNYFKATLVNAHDDLTPAWAQIANAYLEGRISKDWYNYLVWYISRPLQFTDPLSNETVTFTLEYAIRINPYITQGPIQSTLRRTWEDLSRQRYREALNLLQQALNGAPVPTTTTTQETSSPGGEGGQIPISIIILIAVIAIVVFYFFLRRRKV